MDGEPKNLHLEVSVNRVNPSSVFWIGRLSHFAHSIFPKEKIGMGGTNLMQEH